MTLDAYVEYIARPRLEALTRMASDRLWEYHIFTRRGVSAVAVDLVERPRGGNVRRFRVYMPDQFLQDMQGCPGIIAEGIEHAANVMRWDAIEGRPCTTNT